MKLSKTDSLLDVVIWGSPLTSTHLGPVKLPDYLYWQILNLLHAFIIPFELDNLNFINIIQFYYIFNNI